MEGVVSVIPNRILKLHTTRSWDFVGFSKGKLGAPLEGNVVIGLLDSGIWPESDSFNDEGMSAPPAKWKGKCVGANFTCNNKIIGARWYNSEHFFDTTDLPSPRDSEGHGTHTSSTAAGREVQGASYFGLAEGVARGGVPNARIAMYKVCWSFGCSTADPIAIGSFHAMKNGILTSNSAGNSGPYPYSVSNYAPWTLTVAANTIDRKFVAQVVLGNGQVLSGLSVNNFDLNGTTYPLIWGGHAANFSAGASPAIAGFCSPGALNSYKVERKIVLCDAMVTGSQILKANGVGVIMTDSFNSLDYASSFPLPATVISNEDRVKVLNYIRATENPIATILVAQGWKDVMAASVVSFSSRGPNPITPDILKPDITAPGVDILAAWSPLAPPSTDPKDTRRVNFNIISGTSMSCPHASAAAAYVKAGHPNWSPAAIKSALMTTATIMEPGKHVDLEFSYGSGQINPEHALNPGLVYDASEADYINFLCKQGYNTTTLRMITGSNSSVCKSTTPGRAWDLNYPTFALAVEDGQPIQGVFTRTVTNVGNNSSTYTVSMSTPYPVSITVEPPVLTFSKIGEMKTFTVKLFGPKIAQQPIMSGAITWKDGNGHEVRSPVVVYNILPGRKYGIPTSSMTNQKTDKFEGPSMYHKTGILGRN
ncbi:PROPROTEIN CONVERTASE SUBTILISIN/KEXIN [Salix koriyanagi]|uniref:PROPROTEIN CONVERTASE SUBTILISIN/KEXIN n=1 Tax=Salix koriyanagi TaxID=2511006 RepID=A0A9Q0SZ87_9ROSI|nr:PROPROTEIN CONVERTASE SUBTILISIN/KEXIN [Salix koriyanagi]